MSVLSPDLTTAAAADSVGKVTAGVQFQRGVVGDVASPQRLNVVGDQRAAADGGAAGVELAPESVSASSPDFTTWPLPLMTLSNVPPAFSSSVALSVMSPVPSASTLLATSVPPLMVVPPV